ncbi:MAG: glycosyltransferase family 39 protein [Endomicrobiales bacterium]|nr:glycosyltransferase family 39 protein [Endomicrobiales bacterium]
MKKIFNITFAAVLLLFIINIVFSLSTITYLSPTYDEHIHLTAGYSYWNTKDYRLNAFDHPPLAEMWAAIPLIFMRPIFPINHPYWNEVWKYQYPFSDLFMYKNKTDPEKALNSGRRMILVFSLFLGLFIYFWSKELFGIKQAVLALFLWAFSSLFIAHGTLVTTDMALTLFYFTTMYFTWKWWKQIKPGKPTGLKPVIFLGISMGLLLASKYSAIVIFGVIGIIVLWLLWKGDIGAKEIVKQMIVVTFLILLILIVVYRFNSLKIYYFVGLKKVLSGVASGRSSFLLGKHSVTGWVYYFPIAFLLKTPLPFIILLIFAAFRKSSWTREKIIFLLWPALFYFALSCYSKVQIGHRHIMPIYPFLTVWVSGIYSEKYKKVIKLGIACLLIWYCAGTFRIHPWHLSYFNELIGSPANGYKYFTDSNVDWGQGLKQLGKYLKKEGVSGIYLCYFGVGDPHYYGIKYYPIGFSDNISYPNAKGHRDGDEINFDSMKKVIFAVSATNFQATYYYDKQIFSWLKEIPYEDILANSILIFRMDKHPAQYKKLKELVDNLKRPE